MDRRRTLVSSWCYRLKRRVVDRCRPGCERAGVSASVTAAVQGPGESTSTPPAAARSARTQDTVSRERGLFPFAWKGEASPSVRADASARGGGGPPRFEWLTRSRARRRVRPHGPNLRLSIAIGFSSRTCGLDPFALFGVSTYCWPMFLSHAAVVTGARLAISFVLSWSACRRAAVPPALSADHHCRGYPPITTAGVLKTCRVTRERAMRRLGASGPEEINDRRPRGAVLLPLHATSV